MDAMTAADETTPPVGAQEPAPAPERPAADLTIERITEFAGPALHELCDAADAAILDGGGFGWLSPPPRYVMEAYWKGVLLVPERELMIGRLDGVVAGSAQLQRPPKNNEAQALTGQLTTFFVAPWARGYGQARALVEAVEAAARRHLFASEPSLRRRCVVRDVAIQGVSTKCPIGGCSLSDRSCTASSVGKVLL